MLRIYADLPKFKRVHQAMMETVRQTDVTIQEIDKALAGRRTEEEKATLVKLRQECDELKRQRLTMIRSFVMSLE